jgi:hypothetical protein
MDSQTGKSFLVMLFMAISGFFMGTATSWDMGVSLFFALWAIGGMLELVAEK